MMTCAQQRRSARTAERPSQWDKALARARRGYCCTHDGAKIAAVDDDAKIMALEDGRPVEQRR
jgi:hypothetical protein